MEPSEQRAFSRISVAVEAEVRTGGRLVTRCSTQCVSMKGMLLPSAETLPADTECGITLFLGGEGLEIHAEGKVIRCSSKGIAFQFSRLLDMESYTHLRNLILYNATDPDQVEGEFDSAMGIHRKV